MTDKPTPTGTTRDKLMEAALQVFAVHGVKGSTTRQIAQAAGVNEATLFRLFQSKELLLKALVESAAGRIREAFASSEMANQDLQRDLTYYATVYHEVLYQHEPMVRMMMVESQRHPEAIQKLALEAWTPIRRSLMDYLDRAKGAGQVRVELDTEQLVEMLVSMLMGCMLRRKIVPMSFDKDAYLQTALSVFLQGISPPERLTGSGGVSHV